jgi:hypothetical protein
MPPDDGAPAAKFDLRVIATFRYLDSHTASGGDPAQAPQQLGRLHILDFGHL